jgi:ATP-dependent Clp protease adaptor protein ClpS
MRQICVFSQANSGFSLSAGCNKLGGNPTVSVSITTMSTQRDSSGTLLLEKQASEVKPPPMYQVLLLNDDYTPMEFVVLVLQKIFGKGQEEAMRIMLLVHQQGKGVCGVYPRDVAATKTQQVAQFARSSQHPLQCVMEPVGD